MPELNIKEKVVNNRLNLSGWNLTKIPIKEIAKLNISHLDLSNNKISSTKNVFSLLPDLIKLDLSNNQIKSVANDIGSLHKLTYLSLANNQITDLPSGVGNLKQLKYLKINNNPLTSELAEAVGPSESNSQCRSAAINAVQYFKYNKDDSKKQDEKHSKKKDKENRKTVSNGVQNGKLENETELQEKPIGFVSKGFEFFGMLFALTFALFWFLVLGYLSLYALSYYDKQAYEDVKSVLLPLWDFATSFLDPQVASKLNTYLMTKAISFDSGIQTSIQATIESCKWIMEIPIVQQFAENTQDIWSLCKSVFKK